MRINKFLTRYNYSDGQADRIRYIVIHYVGATGGAKANCEYYASKYLGASAHYYVGFEGEIWQSVEDKNIAWHCGAKSYRHPDCRNSNSIGIELCVRNRGSKAADSRDWYFEDATVKAAIQLTKDYRHPDCRNSNSIGIELCVRNRGSKAADSRDWYFEDATVKAAIQLTKELMEKYGVPADRVVRHYDVTGKICPNPYVYNHTPHTWDAFKAALAASEAAVTGWEVDSTVKYRYRKENGVYAANEWLVINHHWYLFGPDGVMLTGWQKWNGSSVVGADEPGDWYFLDNTAGGPLEGACWHSRENGAQEIWEV